jgi:hypothetical protein
MYRANAFILLQIVLIAAVCSLEPASSHAQLPATTHAPPQRKMPDVTVLHVNFHGWDAIVLRNRVAEVTVVPAIGRIMQFKFLSANNQNAAPQGVFWNNPAIGPQLTPDVEGWINYGGDKSWPAPQSNWPKTNGKTWPPPKTFDALPYAVSIQGDQVELLSSVDPNYGIRVRRTISVDPQDPALTIKTTFEKIEGAPVSVSVWSIAQLAMPEKAFILLPPQSAFLHGYVNMLPPPPKGIKSDHRLLAMKPDQKQNIMIGSDGDTLLWVSTNSDLLMENKTAVLPASGIQWPDHGVHSKIYTSATGELKYMELELFTPLSLLKPGGIASMASRYTLLRRTESDVTREAKKIFAASLN